MHGNSAACGTAKPRSSKPKTPKVPPRPPSSIRTRLHGSTASSPEDRFQARGIYGFFPANADGDDIIVWTDETRATERTRFHTLRQQIKKDSGKPNVALVGLGGARGGDLQPVAAIDSDPLSSPTSPSPKKNAGVASRIGISDGATYAVTFRLADSFPQIPFFVNTSK